MPELEASGSESRVLHIRSERRDVAEPRLLVEDMARGPQEPAFGAVVDRLTHSVTDADHAGHDQAAIRRSWPIDDHGAGDDDARIGPDPLRRDDGVPLGRAGGVAA